MSVSINTEVAGGASTGGSGGGHVIEDEGTPVTQRSNLNFAGAGVSVADSGGKTVVTIPGSGGTWGGITGTLADQTDLQAALDAKADWGAPVSVAATTTLTSAVHGGRLLIVDNSAGAINLRLQTDVVGGWGAGDEFAVFALSGAYAVTVEVHPTTTPATLTATSDMLVATTSTRRFLGFKRVATDTWAPTEVSVSSSGPDWSKVMSALRRGPSWAITPNAGAINAVGMAGISTLGTLTTPTLAGGTVFGEEIGTIFTSTAAANTDTGIRSSANLNVYFCGMSPWEVGFIFGSSDALTGCRVFFGLMPATGSVAAVDPSAKTNIIGFAADAADTNLSVMSNDGSGTATKTALSAAFPANGNKTDLYAAFLRYYPASDVGGKRIEAVIYNLTDGVSLSNTITSDLPDSATAMSPTGLRCTGANTTSAVVFIGRCGGGELLSRAA